MPEPQNREQRRNEQFGRIESERRAAQAEQQERALTADDTPPDVPSVRAKSTGHGKKTADKWNQ
jgi:hypothetical protein